MGFNSMPEKKIAASLTALVILPLVGCAGEKAARVVPAIEYTQSVKEGSSANFSFFDIAQKRQQEFERQQAEQDKLAMAANPTVSEATASDARGRLGNQTTQQPQGNVQIQQLKPEAQKLAEKGYAVKRSVALPETESTKALEEEFLKARMLAPQPPPGSSSPYYMGQMSGNASLWPDESQQSSLFRDLRAFQPMDVVTITINESVEGQKRTQTDSQSRFSLLAALTNFFGFLTPQGDTPAGRWNGNNPGLDPENMINAQTNSVYQGTGQTRRLGSLRGKLSAIVLEVLPNGLLRLEGTKIVSVDNEEEVMVVSGLARLRDIDPQNQLDSSRIANMRIDFYGKGVVGDTTNLGWGTRLVRNLWPF
jgi:flagellar L-ring protein precursor FlgH